MNSERTTLGNAFKKLDNNDLYFSQNNNTGSRQTTIFPTPSWNAFGSGVAHSSTMSYFSRVSSSKGFQSFDRTQDVIGAKAVRKCSAGNRRVSLFNQATSNHKIRLSLMSGENDSNQFLTIKDLLDHLVTASILNSDERNQIIQLHAKMDGNILDAWYVYQIYNDIREFVGSVKTAAQTTQTAEQESSSDDEKTPERAARVDKLLESLESPQSDAMEPSDSELIRACYIGHDGLQGINSLSSQSRSRILKSPKSPCSPNSPNIPKSPKILKDEQAGTMLHRNNENWSGQPGGIPSRV